MTKLTACACTERTGRAMMTIVIAAGGCLACLLAGCASKIDPKLVAEVRRSDWYQNAKKEVP
jgi:hypothetical protein